MRLHVVSWAEMADWMPRIVASMTKRLSSTVRGGALGPHVESAIEAKAIFRSDGKALRCVAVLLSWTHAPVPPVSDADDTRGMTE